MVCYAVRDNGTRLRYKIWEALAFRSLFFNLGATVYFGPDNVDLSGAW